MVRRFSLLNRRTSLDSLDLTFRLTPPIFARTSAVPFARVERAKKGRSMPLKKADLKRFKEMLEEKRNQIIQNAQSTLAEDMTLDANDLPDEMDLAQSEYLQSFTFRLRGREKVFLEKIERALVKIKDNSFGTCEECGEEISVKRLEARPETTLCIKCKEDQERLEKDYG